MGACTSPVFCPLERSSIQESNKILQLKLCVLVWCFSKYLYIFSCKSLSAAPTVALLTVLNYLVFLFFAERIPPLPPFKKKKVRDLSN